MNKPKQEQPYTTEPPSLPSTRYESGVRAVEVPIWRQPDVAGLESVCRHCDGSGIEPRGVSTQRVAITILAGVGFVVVFGLLASWLFGVR